MRSMCTSTCTRRTPTSGRRRSTSMNRRSPVESQLARISRSAPLPQYQVPSQERETCPAQPPHKTPPPKDDRLFWGMLALLVSAGAFAVYAKSDPEIRDWLTIRAPWFDDFIAVAYQENMSYGEWASSSMQRLKEELLCLMKNPVAPPCPAPQGGPVVYGPLEKVDNPCGEQVDTLSVSGEANPCAKVRAPVPVKDLCEIDACMERAGSTALAMYTKSRDACRAYNKLVEKRMTIFKVPYLDELRKKMEERLELTKTSIKKAFDASCELDDMQRYFVCGIKGGSKEEIEQTKLQLKDLQNRVKAVRIQFEWDNDTALAKDKQLQQVEELVMLFVREMQAINYGLDYRAEKPVLTGSPDAMLHHTKRYAIKLGAVLEDASIGMTDRVNHGLESLPQDEKSVSERTAKIQKLYAERKAQLDAEYKKRADDQKKKNDHDLKEGLKLQAEKSLKTQNSRLNEKERDMEDTARKVALVEQEGAPLPVYFISWLQSVVLFMKMSGIPQSEIDKVPNVIDPVELGLDTFDLLQRARFWLERDNIANALKYVTALQGASRGASSAWEEDARSHLECRQAAEAVIAHATALGLQYI